MRCLLAAALVVVASAGSRAADAPEDKAKEAALAFLRAVKARNLDDAAKLTGTPFFTKEGEDGKLLEKTDDVKAELKKAFAKPIDEKTFPTDVLLVVPAVKFKEQFGGNAKPETVAQIEKAMGKDGFAVVLGKDGKPVGGTLVAIQDGKAKIVGVLR